MAPHRSLLAALLLLACGSGSGRAPDGDAGSGSVGSAGSSGQGGSGGTSSSTPSPVATQQMDLLLLVDNSISMGDKQELLAQALPELLERLTNPPCIDEAGSASALPALDQGCPQGYRHQFAPVTDLHVGFISSSLADGGANVACQAEGQPRHRPGVADMAHLIGSLPRGERLGANAQGFLEWREGDDVGQLSVAAQELLRAVGDDGCGWEASLESWYRFLVDPEPYRSLVRQPCPDSASVEPNCVALEQVAGRVALDEALLAQRAAFLRPASLLSIVMLSDENDCSFRVGPQDWVMWAIDELRPMFHSAALCATDPNHQCCYSCAVPAPEGCEPDPTCGSDPMASEARVPPAEDGMNLRCFEPRRRFGMDVLYPVERYHNALTQRRLCRSAPDHAIEGCPEADVIDNPLFVSGRTPSSVLLTALVGVPWQSLMASVDRAGAPLSGDTLRFKSATELAAPGDTTWSNILGSPGVPWRPAAEGSPERPSVPPTQPLLPQMIESPLPRPGVLPGNALNGREYDTSTPTIDPTKPNDLQYACIFPLPEPIDCLARDRSTGEPCGCYDQENDSPLCEQQPGSSPLTTTQWWAPAWPGVRHVDLLQRYGANAVLASICPRNTDEPSGADFGYRPAISALLERLQVLNGR